MRLIVSQENSAVIRFRTQSKTQGSGLLVDKRHPDQGGRLESNLDTLYDRVLDSFM